MDPNRFIKVFDILDVGFQTWIMVASGLLFVAFGLAQILLAIVVRFSGIRVLDFRAARTVVSGSFMVMFGVLFTVVGGLALMQSRLRGRSAASSFISHSPLER